MKNGYLFVIIISILCSCHNTGNQKLSSVTIKDSAIKTTSVTITKTVNDDTLDSLMNAEPTAAEVLKQTLDSYNKIEETNNLIVDGKDSLKVHLRYYCLHDSTLIIPARYDFREKPQKEFRTHNFAAKITIVRNQDTVFNHVVLKSWFNKVIDEPLKQYATLVTAGFYNYNKQSKHLQFTFSISIPMTDVGIGTTLLIDKNGGYEITK